MPHFRIALLLACVLRVSSAGAADLPPDVPSNPSPADNSVSVPNPLFQWQSEDPDGIPVFYVYLDWGGPDTWIAWGSQHSYQLPWSLPPGTYTWHIEALAAPNVVGPTWTFTVGPGAPPNSPPNAPTPAYPPDGYWGQQPNPTLAWNGSDPDHQPLAYDLYFGTTLSPPKIASNLGGVGTQFYQMLNLAYATTYYWYVTERDPFGAVTTGPTWSFRTREQNPPPNVPSPDVPTANATVVPVNTPLEWNALDPDYQPLTFDVYFGTEAVPPLVSDDQTAQSYDPGLLAISTEYHWRVVARDSYGAQTSSPQWTFTTANTTNQIPDTPSRIYPIEPLQPAHTSVTLSWNGLDPDGEQLTFYVYLGTMYPDSKHPLVLMGTTTDHQFVASLNSSTRYYWTVEARDSYWSVKPDYPWQFDNGTVPVLFSRFGAREKGSAVEVSWLLHSDEAMDSYTLYRRESDASALAMATAPVTGVEGSYVDTSVEAGKTYHYELLVRTTDGDEFRSPVATVATTALGLALHQNIPNPFNPLTTIRYDLPLAARVRLSIVEVSGRRVRTLVDEQQAAGSREILWNGRDDDGHAVSSGVYFYVLDAGKQRLTRKLVLLK